MQNAGHIARQAEQGAILRSRISLNEHYYWLPWLQKQLVIRGIPTATPEVPNNWIADYPTWLKEFERYEITPETILIGHSCGGGFILRWGSASIQA